MFRACSLRQKASLKTSRGISNSVAKDLGGVMISPASHRMVSGNSTVQMAFLRLLISGTCTRRNSPAKEMCRASSATWICMTLRTAGG
ncbi:Uncharacterised protein [Mycobacteroides abscessus subsp. abscessus]|nr:Uncharacterised protein [Mycobacteroides abscessus subsp. abscessus]